MQDTLREEMSVYVCVCRESASAHTKPLATEVSAVTRLGGWQDSCNVCVCTLYIQSIRVCVCVRDL